jgi:hypothetical protein
MMEGTRTQLLKWVARAMVVVDMNLIPPKAIGKEAYLWAKSPFELSRDLAPKRHLNT